MKKNIVRLMLCCLFLPIACHARDTYKVKILPIGDSITCASKYKVSYRYPLWKQLVDAGKMFEFVGSQTLEGNYGRVNWPVYKGLRFPPVNEAHAGWRTDQILHGIPSKDKKGLDSWLTAYKADIALIHLGTNDVYQSQSAESTRDELEQLILRLRKNNPKIKVLLASIIPMNNNKNQYINHLNHLLGGLAVKLYQPQSPVVNVDMNTGFDVKTDLLKDKIHPNANGEKKMAKRWFDALIRHHFI